MGEGEPLQSPSRPVGERFGVRVLVCVRGLMNPKFLSILFSLLILFALTQKILVNPGVDLFAETRKVKKMGNRV